MCYLQAILRVTTKHIIRFNVPQKKQVYYFSLSRIIPSHPIFNKMLLDKEFARNQKKFDNLEYDWLIGIGRP